MHSVILSGGVGSRLWPVSRDLHPKPFIKVAEGESFLQRVYSRSISIPFIQSIMTITNKELLFKTKNEYEEIAIKHSREINHSYIIEPFGRNTAPAIAMAALEIKEKSGEDAIILLLPSDHIIKNESSFLEAVSIAKEMAESGKIVTFGIEPDRPETGYGYIESNGNEVVRFVEKPSLDKAKGYLESKNFLWNSGMFCFSCKTILEEMEEHCPDILLAIKECYLQSNRKNNSAHRVLDLDPVTFRKVPEKSIDYAVLEKSKRTAVVPCNIGWSDIGTWSAMSELIDPDANGNVVKGNIITHDVHNCFIDSGHRVVGAVGVENLVIIDTEDALLVVDKNKSQDVKNIYSQLKSLGHSSHKVHRVVQRPWGTYTILEEGPGFKIKRIEVYPGASLSLQMHNHRAEHWVIVGGVAQVINGEDELILNVNESTFIPIGCKHRLTNPGTEKLIMIEVQTGLYLGEDDIVRFDDIYGRIPDAA